MEVSLDRQQGRNAWLTVGLREGKNREIRRAMESIGLLVNRLIRVSYGPFRLGELKPGELVEVKPKVLRDQLGLSDTTQPKISRRNKPKSGVDLRAQSRKKRNKLGRAYGAGRMVNIC